MEALTGTEAAAAILLAAFGTGGAVTTGCRLRIGFFGGVRGAGGASSSSSSALMINGDAICECIELGGRDAICECIELGGPTLEAAALGWPRPRAEQEEENSNACKA